MRIRAGMNRRAVCGGTQGATLPANFPRRPGKNPSFLQSANYLPDITQGPFGREAKMLREGGRDVLQAKAAAQQIPDGLAGRIEHHQAFNVRPA
jgi:hypothetical protein